jgi:hypothetical protein
MDDELFKQKLSEVAEWRLPKLTPTDIREAKKSARGRRSREEIYQEEHEQVFAELFDGVNPTFPPEIIRIKPAACKCEDCGRHCAAGRQKETKLYETGGKRNWRSRCLTCEMHQNPFTGKYDLKSSEASRFWTDFLRETKGIYNTEGNALRAELAKSKINQNTDNVVFEDDKEVIKKYHDD